MLSAKNGTGVALTSSTTIYTDKIFENHFTNNTKINPTKGFNYEINNQTSQPISTVIFRNGRKCICSTVAGLAVFYQPR